MRDEESHASTSKTAESSNQSIIEYLFGRAKQNLWRARQEAKKSRPDGDVPIAPYKRDAFGPVYTPPYSPDSPVWDRVLSIYQSGISMERDVIQRVCSSTFMAGFFIGGISGYKEAGRVYEQTHVGKQYLSQRDALVRRMDYGIVRFAINGCRMGLKAMAITGSIVAATTHVAAARAHFSPLYFPAISAVVGGVFTFPLGPVGVAKAVGLGITSGLTLSAMHQLFALSIDHTADEAYWYFKSEYEKDLSEDLNFEQRVQQAMEDNPELWWRAKAVQFVREQDERERAEHDA